MMQLYVQSSWRVLIFIDAKYKYMDAIITILVYDTESYISKYFMSYLTLFAY